MDQNSAKLNGLPPSGNQSNSGNADVSQAFEEESGSVYRSCSICSQLFSSSEAQLRPYVLSCGHSFCLKCLETQAQNSNYNCGLCKAQNTLTDCGKFRYIRNYALEDFIDWHDKAQFARIQAQKMKGAAVRFCCDCEITYHPSSETILELDHSQHKTFAINTKKEADLKKAFWLLKVIKQKKVDLDDAKLFTDFLQDLQDEIKKHFKKVQENFEEPSKCIESLRKDYLLVLDGIDEPSSYQDKKLVDSLLWLREFQTEKAESVLLFMKQAKPEQWGSVAADLLTKLKADACSSTPGGMSGQSISPIQKPNKPAAPTVDSIWASGTRNLFGSQTREGTAANQRRNSIFGSGEGDHGECERNSSFFGSSPSHGQGNGLFGPDNGSRRGWSRSSISSSCGTFRCTWKH